MQKVGSRSKLRFPALYLQQLAIPHVKHGLDILVTRRRDARAAERFFRKLLKGQGGSPWQLVTDKLGSYAAAHRTGRYENNRAEVSHQHSRERERYMRQFKSVEHA